MTEPTDAELIALLGDRQFSTIGAVREALRRWGTPAVAKWAPEEIADGERGIRWVTNEGIHGRPTDHDVREYLKRTPTAHGCHCDECKQFYTTPQPTQAQAEPKSGAKSFQTYGEANAYSKGYYAGKKAATQAQAGAVPQCWCLTCRPMRLEDPYSMRMALCPACGNKRCPKANDHRNTCTGSNEPGQPGSAYVGGIKGGQHVGKVD